MRYRSRVVLATAAVGFASALALMLVTFVVKARAEQRPLFLDKRQGTS